MIGMVTNWYIIHKNNPLFSQYVILQDLVLEEIKNVINKEESVVQYNNYLKLTRRLKPISAKPKLEKIQKSDHESNSFYPTPISTPVPISKLTFVDNN